jgi:hypothetical protein
VTKTTWALLVIGGVGAAAGVGLVVRADREAKARAQANVEQDLVRARAAREQLEELAKEPPAPLTMSDALAVAKPSVEQVDQGDAGTIDFIRWAMRHMRWDDVAIGRNETTFAKVMKDPEVERGRVLCAVGELAEIIAVSIDAKKIHSATMVVTDQVNSGAPIRIFAIGDTGELVAGSKEVVFCGVVLGAVSYQSLVGPKIRALHTVGMFGTKTNQATARPKPGATPSASARSLQ